MTMVRIGQAVPRGEDARLLQGRGRYADDVTAADQARAFVLRSTHAHADIGAIDPSAAVEVPGVLAILTAEALPNMIATCAMERIQEKCVRFSARNAR